MKKFLLNIANGKIHKGIFQDQCRAVKKMKESNQKWFDVYEEAENYYEGKTKKGEICGICFKSKEEAIRYEKRREA